MFNKKKNGDQTKHPSKLVNEIKKEYSSDNEVKSDSEKKFYRIMTFVMLFITIAFIIGTIVSMGISSANKKAAAKRLASYKPEESIPNVSVEVVATARYFETLHMNASIKSPLGSVSIVSPVNGKVLSSSVKLGDKVKTGDILGYVDASDIGMNYEKAPVYAKATGTVTAINAYPGSPVSAQTSLYVIVPDSDFLLSASISEKNLGALKIGDIGYFTTTANPEIRFKAKLRYIAPLVDKTTRTAELEFDVIRDANFDKLRQGMLVSLDVETGIENDVITVPNNAIKEYINDQTVFVVDSDNIARRTVVTLGRNNGERTIVASGLSVGDKVVTAGSVRDAQKVNIL